MKKDYVATIYDDKRTVRTDYPYRLAVYLFKRFNMRQNDKVLEVGCGRGEFIQAFKKLGLDCYGVDISDYSIEKLSDIKMKKTDVTCEPLPYADNTFDVVYHKSLIEHFFSPDNLTKETYRVLKPGGRVIILTPDWVSTMKVFYEDFTHCRPYDKNSLHDLLEIYGFADVQSELFYQYPMVWNYPALKIICRLLQCIISTPMARRLTQVTGIKFFRWSIELMALATAVKK